MPINKSARTRFDIIDECLRNTKKKWSKIELLYYINRRLELQFGEGHGISSSQLRYDLEHMQTELGAPLELYRSGKGFYYRYVDSSFSIKTIPLDEEDIAKLNDGVQLLMQIKGFKIANEIAEVVHRLESRYNFSARLESASIFFDAIPETRGGEYLEDLYHAILRRNVLKVVYRNYNERNGREYNIHPYLLREYDHRWFLVGHCHERSGIEVLALDGMDDVRISKMQFIERKDFNCEKYFQDVIGVNVFPDRDIEVIDLLFSQERATCVSTKPLHNSQEIIGKYDDGSVRVRLHLIINPELVSVILGFGRDVKVIHPNHLATQVQNIYSAAKEQYNLA